MRNATVVQRWTLIAACLFSILVIAGSVSASDTPSTLSPDMMAIQGSWVRSDGPYVIELNYEKDGLQATYFNRKLINVGKTELAEQDGSLQVLIELQDVNYPGSTYVLTYNRAQDTLQGIYFQAVSQQTYEVGFIRNATKK